MEASARPMGNSGQPIRIVPNRDNAVSLCTPSLGEELPWNRKLPLAEAVPGERFSYTLSAAITHSCCDGAVNSEGGWAAHHSLLEASQLLQVVPSTRISCRTEDQFNDLRMT